MSMELATIFLSSALLLESAAAFVQPPPPPLSSQSMMMKKMLISPHFVHQRRARSTAMSMAADVAVDDGSEIPRVLWCVLVCCLEEEGA